MLFPFSFMKTVPVVPVATAATGVGSTSFTANWNAFSGASYYLLDVSLSSSFSTFVLQNTVTTATSYVVTGLTSSTTYYYRVRAAINVDSDVAGFVSRVYTAGGTLSYTEVTATETLVADLKSYGIWTSMKAVYPMVGASAAACAQNLVSSSFTGTFSSGWTFASTGVKGNGTSTYMNTALIPNGNLNTNSLHLSYYSRTDTNLTQVEMGCDSPYTLLEIRTSNQTYFLINTSSIAGVSDTNSIGFYIGNRTGSAVTNGFKNNSKIFNGTLASGTLSSRMINIGAMSVNAAGNSNLYYSTKECAFASIGDGLTDTQAADFYTCVNSFQVSLSRNV